MNQKTQFKWVMSTQYFLYFGALGAFLPYFNLYCYYLGFSGFQIGLLSAVRSLALVVCPILWGMLADRFRARRPIFIFCNLVSACIWSLYLHYTEFDAVFIISCVYGIFFAPLISFLEAFTVDGLGREKKSYGRIRVWGTLAFIGVVTILGRVMDQTGVQIILILILFGGVIQTLGSLMIPRIKVAPRSKGTEGDIGFLFKPETLLFLASGFLMLVSHGAYYGFFSIHLEQLGHDKTFIGLAWALAAASEVLVMVNSERIFNRFSYKRVLLFSFAAAALRWMLLFSVRTPLLILASQLLHAITYGSFHIASILYIDHLTPDESKTVGQAVNNGVTYGLGMMTGFFLTGLWFERLGSFNSFLISSGIALAGGALLMTGQLVKRRKV